MQRPTDPLLASPITRREALQCVTALLGGAALVGGSGLLAGCADARIRSTVTTRGTGTFTPADVAFLDEVAETILPATSTPGAKAAQTGAFMAAMVTAAYDERSRRIFRGGMRQIDEICLQAHAVPFVEATPEQRLALLEPLDRVQKAHRDARSSAAVGAHYFRMMKELALLGYFTSEIGYRQVLRYIETPGRFDPCVPYSAGETIWAPHA